MKIELDDTLSGRDLSKIGANFQKIENALNDQVLYRESPEGEPNQMENLLDMNGERIINLPVPSSPNDAARLQDVTNAVAGIVPASAIPFAPSLGMVATNVQAAILEVWSGFTSLATSIGSSLIGFLQAGAGAVVRTVQSKLRDDINVKDFGAVGDGVTDDTLAIQAAIDSIHTNSIGDTLGGTVFLPRGRFKISTSLKLRGNISLKGAGGKASIIEASDCDGVEFTVGIVDHNMQVIEDVGFLGTAGTNRVGILAPTRSYPDNQNDGFFINRCNIRNFNIGIMFLNAWQSGITNCDISNVNSGIILDEHGVLVNIVGNTLTREAGGPGSNENLGIGILGDDVEAVEVASNFIYGFATAIKAPGTWSLVIKSNTLLTVGEAQIGIDYTTAKEHLNIFDNIIESVSTLTSVVFGIVGRPASSWGGGTTVIRDNRIFDDFGLGTSTGIQINSSTDTQNNNVCIYDNNFVRFTVGDIVVYNPIRITIERNRCESTAPTNSISILTPVLCQGPIFVTENWCTKGLSLSATHVANGNIVARDNAINGVWIPYELYNQNYTPVNASTDPVTITVTSAKWSRQGKQYVVYLDLTWPVTAGTELARVTLPVIADGTYFGACGYTTIGAPLAYNTTAVAANFILFNSTGGTVSNAAMSGKRVTATIIYNTV